MNFYLNLNKIVGSFLILFLFNIFFIGRALAADNIPLDFKISQMIMMGFHGTESKDYEASKLLNYAKTGEIGGILILKYNIKDKKQITGLIKSFKNAENPQYPLLIAIDQEGGQVQRLNQSNGFKNYPSAKQISESMSPDKAKQIYLDMAESLKDTGINFNLAPVVDLDINPDSPAIGKKQRSFSNDPNKVVLFAEKFIDAHREKKVLTSLKHFPGHGSALSDSHLGFTDVTDTWQNKELLPYFELIKRGKADSIMSSHIFNRNIDDRLPASLSQKHIQQILREKLGYNGVIITDDLQMAAISNNYSFKDTVINAINAGNDILLFSNYFKPDINIPVKVKKIVLKAVKEGKIKRERIEESFSRITQLKESGF
ncbi:MAG: glycoside hydrolase family 3 protein [bacterium]